VDGEPDTKWRECTVTDISPGGVGVVLSDELSEHLIGQNATIVVELNAAVLYAETEGRRHGSKVGVQFDRLSEVGAGIVHSFRTFGGHW
jgi:hypothetical protein